MTTEQTTNGDGVEKNEGWRAAIDASLEQGKLDRRAAENRASGEPVRKFEDALPCPLTESEYAAYAKKLAEFASAIESLEADKKASLSKFNKDIGTLDGARTEMSKLVVAGLETRSVECAQYNIFEQNEVRIVRLDTGEEVSSRPMTRAERQVDLPGVVVDTPPTDIVDPDKLLDDAMGDDESTKKKSKKSGK